jgi:hypothetical protein
MLFISRAVSHERSGCLIRHVLYSLCVRRIMPRWQWWGTLRLPGCADARTAWLWRFGGLYCMLLRLCFPKHETVQTVAAARRHSQAMPKTGNKSSKNRVTELYSGHVWQCEAIPSRRLFDRLHTSTGLASTSVQAQPKIFSYFSAPPLTPSRIRL